MSSRSFVSALQSALEPHQFDRRGDDWIRVRGDIWECVNRQAGRGGVTVNLYMRDLQTEKLYRKVFADDPAAETPAIYQRLGILIDGYDHWWKAGERDSARNMAAALVEHGLPWFDRVRTLEDQAEIWFRRSIAHSTPSYYGYPLVQLALTLYRMGEVEEACALVRRPPPRTALPDMIAKVSRTSEWLGCCCG